MAIQYQPLLQRDPLRILSALETHHARKPNESDASDTGSLYVEASTSATSTRRLGFDEFTTELGEFC
jgi:hypothetical protein